jgi:putative hydrolase of the HAD superfamily
MRDPIACVVFDIDDTLYLERDYIRSGFDDVGRWVETELGFAGFFDRCWYAFQSGVRARVFDVVLAAQAGADPDVIRSLVDRYRSHTPSIALLPDAEDALGRLAGRYRLAGLSDGPLTSQRAKVQALGLTGRLDPIVFTDELGRASWKPAPDGFRLIEARLGYAGPAYCYVADNPAKDFRGPSELGWRTVRVRRGAGLHHDEPSGPDVDVEVGDLSSIERLLVELGATEVPA